MTVILGIDPGYGSMGFGCIDANDGSVTAMDYGAVVTDKASPTFARLNTLHDDVTELISTFSPDWIAIEKMFFCRMGNTVQVAQARGVILLAIAQNQMTPFEFTPNQVKKSVTGDGSAQKRAVQEAVVRELNLDGIPRPDDAADGLAIALTAWFHRHELV